LVVHFQFTQFGRTDKAEATLKPDSQKTTTERLGDSIKGTMDNVASTLQPQVRIFSSFNFGQRVIQHYL
jgi:hypothetical protein